MGVIVVGVDHSEGARAALRFAFEEARLRGAALRVVHTWQYGYFGAPEFGGVVPVMGADYEPARQAAEKVLTTTVQEVLPEPGEIEIEQRVVEGVAAGVLVAESRDAELLVVGSRGHGGFAGLLLGSVSQQVSHHASCPVVIVHPPRGD